MKWSALWKWINCDLKQVTADAGRSVLIFINVSRKFQIYINVKIRKFKHKNFPFHIPKNCINI